MWQLNDVNLTRDLTANVPGERLMLQVEAVFGDGTQTVTIPFKAENKDVLDRTLRQIVDKLNVQDNLLANQGSYTIPPEPTPPAPTPVELAEADFEQALQDFKRTQEMHQAMPSAIPQTLVDQAAVIVQQKYVAWQNLQ